MSALRAFRLGVLCVAVATNCAKAPQSTPAPAADRTEPPRLLTRVSYPELRVIEPNPTGRPSLRMRVQVMVDTLGRADVRTLKLIGEGGMQNRVAMERWLDSVVFRPAMRNGQAVRGLFEMTLTVRVEVRR